MLQTLHSSVSVYEGGDVEIPCSVRDTYFTSNITWYNHLRQPVIEYPSKYALKRAGIWTNLTVKGTDSLKDSGRYWCSGINSVGSTEIPITLLVNSKDGHAKSLSHSYTLYLNCCKITKLYCIFIFYMVALYYDNTLFKMYYFDL